MTLTPLAPLLLLIALLLLPFDVAVRRLLVTRSDLARLRAAISRRGAEVAERTGRAARFADGRESPRAAADHARADRQPAAGFASRRAAEHTGHAKRTFGR